MRIPLDQHVEEEFDERNHALVLLLGLLGATERLDGLVQRYVPDLPPPGSEVAADEAGAWLDVVLGTVALREQFRAVAEEGADDLPDEAEPVGATSDFVPREILR